MIAVAADGVARVDLRPLVEEQMVVVWILLNGPAIEQFVHHEKSHAVAQIEELGGGRIVRGADGVDADLLERFEPPFPDAERHGRAEGAAIVVETDALDFEILSVEPEAGGGLEPELANAERRHIVVKRSAALADFDDGAVKHWTVKVPELRILDADVLLEIRGFTGRNGLGHCLGGLYGFVIGSNDGGLHRYLSRGVGLVDHCGLHMDHGLVGFDLGRGDERAPLVDVDRVGCYQANVAINARPAVPARSRLSGIIGAHGEDIRLVFAEVQMPGQFVAETDVTVGPLAEVEAVDPDVAVGHDAVEVDEDATLGIIRRKYEMLAIPADAGGQKAARAAGGIICIERAFDAPVMGHVQAAPRGVIKVGFLGVRGIGLEKAPIKVEGCGDSSTLGRIGRRSGRR